MLPHPEGGYYKETYRSSESIAHSSLPDRFSGARSFSTAIYFLMESGDFSAFHRIKSDECWHFYEGQPLIIQIIHENGRHETVRLGRNPDAGERLQFVVPANCWFASIPDSEGDFSLVGCTVSPGFDFSDFELASAPLLSSLYPQHRTLIESLCRG